jgi:hypothetical protein
MVCAIGLGCSVQALKRAVPAIMVVMARLIMVASLLFQYYPQNALTKYPLGVVILFSGF